MFFKPSDCYYCGRANTKEYHEEFNGYCIEGGIYEDATSYEPIGMWRLFKGLLRSLFSRRYKLELDSFDDV